MGTNKKKQHNPPLKPHKMWKRRQNKKWGKKEMKIIAKKRQKSENKAKVLERIVDNSI